MFMFQIVLTAVITAVLSNLLGYLAAWGLIPGLDVKHISSEWAVTISATVSATIAGIFAAWFARAKAVLESAGIKTLQDLVDRLGTKKVVDAMPKNEVLDAVGKMPEVTSVIVKTDELAKSVPSGKVQQG